MKSICVVAVSNIKPAETLAAVQRTYDALPDDVVRSSVIMTPKSVKDQRTYSEFVLFELPGRVKADYALVVQWDGYAICPENWDHAFLSYDYVGAPIPPWYARTWRTVVGNGGFSLRSRRWMDAGLMLRKWWRGENEDRFLCRTQRRFMEDGGCRIAPVEVAIRFSHEHRVPGHWLWKDRDSFGFHGRFNKPHVPAGPGCSGESRFRFPFHL